MCTFESRRLLGVCISARTGGADTRAGRHLVNALPLFEDECIRLDQHHHSKNRPSVNGWPLQALSAHSSRPSTSLEGEATGSGEP
jgi:hypothetical protein